MYKMIAVGCIWIGVGMLGLNQPREMLGISFWAFMATMAVAIEG